MLLRQIVDDKLAQYAYLVGCQQTGEALLVDPQRDVDRYLDVAAREGLRITAVAETHIHADFLSGAREIAARLPRVKVLLSNEGDASWKYDWPSREPDIDVVWLRDGDVLRVGRVELRAWHTPGHSPEHLSFVVTDTASGASAPMGMLSGDFVFVGDVGRPDLLEISLGVPGVMRPSARQLNASLTRLAALPDFVQIWPGHGAGSACGKALGAVPSSTVGYERHCSKAIAAWGRGETAFVDFVLAGQAEPPAYFSRVKSLNRTGVPRAAALPAPRQVNAAELAALAGEPRVQIVDTRLDRHAVFAGHVVGSLYAPLNRAFPTVIGSFVDPDRPLVLVVDGRRLDEAVRDLCRIGYDQVDAWAPPAVVDELRDMGAPLGTLESIGFAEFEERRDDGDVLDVRSAAEHGGRRVPASRNIPHTRLRERWSELPSRGPVYVHCLSGARAAASAMFLARHGINAIHVDGAFASWIPRSADVTSARP